MKVLSLFSGIGAFEKALEKLEIKYELVGFSEIDKYAIKSYCAVHGVDENLNLGDITKIQPNMLPKDVDLITHGSPCQDFSVAGKQAGGDMGTGTRSSLMWNTVNIITYCKPKYVIWENVKNLLSKKHRHNFDAYISILESLGYNNYYEVLNAKDYGIPQNRERVYTISIRKDIDNGEFVFPEKTELRLRLRDIIENYVDEKYYLNDKQILRIQTTNYNVGKTRIQEKDYCDTILARDWKDPKCIQVGELDIKGMDCVKRVYSPDGLSPTLTDMQGGNRQPKIEVFEGCSEKKIIIDDTQGYDGIRIYNDFCPTLRAGRSGLKTLEEKTYERTPLKFLNRNQKNIEGDYAFCVDSSNTGGIKETTETKIRIRKLTPRECWRLMGFSDWDFEKAMKVPTSNSQLYKQAGNSIVVNVLVEIFKNLFMEERI